MQTALGFDFGLKRIGVAVGQTITHTATPITTLAAKNGAPNWAEVSDLIKKWRPTTLLVGIPLNMDDSEQSLTILAREFAHKLADIAHLPVIEVDERLSTREARLRLSEMNDFKAFNHQKVDQLAACIIIETWLHQQ